MIVANNLFFTTGAPTTSNYEQVGRNSVSGEPIVVPTTIESVRLNGLDGNDTFTVDNIGDQVVENLNEGTDAVNASVTYVLGANVENLTLSGSAAINGALVEAMVRAVKLEALRPLSTMAVK